MVFKSGIEKKILILGIVKSKLTLGLLSEEKPSFYSCRNSKAVFQIQSLHYQLKKSFK